MGGQNKLSASHFTGAEEERRRGEGRRSSFLRGFQSARRGNDQIAAARQKALLDAGLIRPADQRHQLQALQLRAGAGRCTGSGRRGTHEFGHHTLVQKSGLKTT